MHKCIGRIYYDKKLRKYSRRYATTPVIHQKQEITPPVDRDPCQTVTEMNSPDGPVDKI